jgi:6,7-dimethyl-8-ribityllumazine synthase
MDLSASTGVPCLFGVLTTETIQQAWDRTGGVHGHKGRESAAGALEMIAVVRQLRSNLP